MSNDDQWGIRFGWGLAVEQEPITLTEYCFAWILTITQHGSGTRVTSIRIEVVQPRTKIKLLERHFGCPVVTGALSSRATPSY